MPGSASLGKIPMLERVKNPKRLVIRSYLVLIPAALFLYLGIFNTTAQTPLATPQPERVNITPSAFEVAQDKAGNGWENPGAALFAENLEMANSSEFNQENSAFFVVGTIGSTSTELPVINPPAEIPADTAMPIDDQPAPGADALLEDNKPAAGQAAEPSGADCTQATTCTAPIDNNSPATEPSQDLVPTESSAPLQIEPAAAPIQESAPAEPVIDSPTSRSPWHDLDKIFGLFSTQKVQAQSAGSSSSTTTHDYAVIYKDFSLPAGSLAENNIANVQLRLSMAARAAGLDDKIKIYYNIGSGWFDTGVLFVNQELANKTNQGYFLFGLPIFESWKDLSKLQIKVVYAQAGNEAVAAYLDGIWLEVDYIKAGLVTEERPREQLKKETRLSQLRAKELSEPFTLEQVSSKISFKTVEKPDFNFLYRRKQGIASGLLSGLLGLFTDQYQGITVTAEVMTESGRLAASQPVINYLADGEYHVQMPNLPRNFKPGKYAMIINIQDGDQIYVSVKDFSWGVLAINANKSIYLPAESSYLQMGVLDDNGNTICDADLYLEVTAPDGGVAYLNTDNGLITRNELCGPNNVIDEPDYFTHYGLAGSGTYQLKLTANTKNGVKEITDKFEVLDNVAFEVERVGPTRIWPVANYPMSLRIKANEDYSGLITDVMPASFQIANMAVKLNGQELASGQDYEFDIAVDYDIEKDAKILNWQGISLKKDDFLEIEYSFDAPDISPEFYLLGPLKIGDFAEARPWQIASDAVLIFNARSGVSVGTGWSNITYAWDSVTGSNNLRAVDIAPNPSTWPIAYIKSTSNTATATATSSIVRVEIGFEGLTSSTNLDAELRPMFNGSATGTATFFAMSTTEATRWADVTTNALAPGLGNWKWSDVANLGVAVNATPGNGARTISIDQLYVRVTVDSTKPVGIFNSLVTKRDGSGVVDAQIQVTDAEGGYSKAKLEYVNNATCDFSVNSYDPTIEPTDASTTATYFDPKVDNDSAYQIGTTTGWIVTASGSNAVSFDWDSQTDLPNGDEVYCLKLTVNDGAVDATSSFATTTIDNVAPTAPGDMTATTSALGNGIVLTFGASSTETNFSEYKIFYAKGTSGVSEADSVVDKNINPDLGYADYNGSASLTISDLDPQTDYVVNIWAYDSYGHKASSTELTVRTGKAEPVRANTVYFLAGQYTSANGVNGQNSDTAQTFSPNSDFDFSLAETGAKIKNAYIIFEAHFEAYADNAGNYTGYDLQFDTCQKPCTPNALSGVGAVSKTDSTILAYHQNAVNSNYVRLLFDVTNEAQLAAYQGDSEAMAGQVSYNIKRGAAVNSISEAKAILVVTYEYAEAKTVDLTNTVIYPLESTVAGDSGTRLSAYSTLSCVFDSNCPSFNYKFDVPESKARLDQWFQTYNQNYLGTTFDLNVNVKITGVGNVSSGPYIYELQQGSGQGSSPVMYFKDVSGFEENATSTLQYQPLSPGYTGAPLFYLIGGEAMTTYVASSSDSEKTRTVAFPLGVVSNGNVTTQGVASTDVYFPENGQTTGAVRVKKAWFRIISTNGVANATVRTMTVASKTGTKATTSNFVYRTQANTNVIKPSFNIFHVMPNANGEYAELESANIATPKTVTLSAINSVTGMGGVSAELMVTYTYASEAAGHLSSLNIYGGQAYQNGNVQLSTTSFTLIAPEANDAKTLLGSSLLSSYLISDSDFAPTATNFLVDMNASSSAPVCATSTAAHYLKLDSTSFNPFAEAYKVTSPYLSIDNNSRVYGCYSNNGGADTTGGAKMNGQFRYTYKYEAPQPLFIQDNWQWWENIDALDPITYKAAEQAGVGNINLADTVRLRLAAGPTLQDLLANAQTFKLQYGYGSTTCSASTSIWTDVGTTTSNVSWISIDNSQVEDGSSTGNLLLSNTIKFQSYEEDNPSALNSQALTDGTFGEYDWVVHNNNATSSLQYCFRIVRSSGVALKFYNSYPWLVTAASNTAPNNATDPEQLYSAGTTTIPNGTWLNQTTVRLAARMTDVNINQEMRLYFQLATTSGLFRTATSVPVGACTSTTAYTCASKIWLASSTVGDYRITPFTGTATISNIPQDSAGYKWQVLACDSKGACADWVKFDLVTPNFYVDTLAPSRPGALTAIATTTESVTLRFGATTTEANFLRYRIFYKQATSSVKETDLEKVDGNFLDINFFGATTTTINSLSAGKVYVFNIWAYDKAGNSTSSLIETRATTTSSIQSPSVSMLSSDQWTNGTGEVHIGIKVDDPDNDDTLRVRMEYDTYDGVSCKFLTPAKMTLNPLDENTYAYVYGTFNPAGDPKVDNSSFYQVGTTTGWILSSTGTSTVYFDWSSQSDVPTANGEYCMRAIVWDGSVSQIATSSPLYYTVDNVAPTAPGILATSSKNSHSITLKFGTTSVDTHFDRYRIFYSTTSPVDELGVELDDNNLVAQNFNLAATTTITGLLASTTYYINIWAYDIYGNRTSSTQQRQVTTNIIPISASSTGQYSGGLAIANGDWITTSTISLIGQANDFDAVENLTLYFELINSSLAFTTATSVPANPCSTSTVYTSCASKIWQAGSASVGNYSVTPFKATATISGIATSSTDYKWQVMSCDDDGDCSDWSTFNAVVPNFKLDTIKPTAPGQLVYSSKTSTQVTLSFGATTTEANFWKYRLLYATGTAPTASSPEQISANLNTIDYNGASLITVNSLDPSQRYYFSLWAYDLAGQVASSVEMSVITNDVVSTPGVYFYTKNTRFLYYRVWSGTAWGAEQTGPQLGSAAGDNIRQLESLVSDDKGKVAIIAKTWDGTNQEWWGTVYKVAANSFISSSTASSTRLGVSQISTNLNQNFISSCIGSLSSGQFFAIHGNTTTLAPLVYTWDLSNGWQYIGLGPTSARVLMGCRLTRQPATDNYLLTIHDNNYRVGEAFYSGTTTYDNTKWTNLTALSTVNEPSLYNFVGESFFDPGDFSRGAYNYNASTTALNTVIEKFTVDGAGFHRGTAVRSPVNTVNDRWNTAVQQSTLAADPGSAGITYLLGDDSSSQLNLYRVDITGDIPVWSTTTNGKNVASGSAMYLYSNYAQKPYDMAFYKDHYALITWNTNVSSTTKYKVLNANTNYLNGNTLPVPGSTASIWSRTKQVRDPNMPELFVGYQNLNAYAGIFWGASSTFYTSGNQAWTNIATSAASLMFSRNDQSFTYSFTGGNSAPNTPTAPYQLKSDSVTTLPNQDWSTSTTVYFGASATDPDTSEMVTLYVQLATTSENFITDTTKPSGACTWGTAYGAACPSGIWFVASSSVGDYSVTPFTNEVSVTGIPQSSTGYKWQVISCDDSTPDATACSSWADFNPSLPNFKVDSVAPTNPGSLTVINRTSNSVILRFGATTTETNFLTYRLYYSTSSSITEASASSSDINLSNILFNGKSTTTITDLASSTLYYFKIWAYDLAGNKSSSTITSTTTISGPIIAQTNYVFENDDGATVNANSTSTLASTSLNNVIIGQRLNARIQIDNRGGDVAVGEVYKLQFNNFTDAPAVWADVSNTSEIAFGLGLSGTNDNVLTSAKMATTSATSRTWTNGTWHEQTASSSALTLGVNYYTEIAYALRTHKALAGKTYRLRLVDSAGQVLGVYTNYPTLKIIAVSDKRYSKAAMGTPPAGLDSYYDLDLPNDLGYYFDFKGYNDIASIDGFFDSLTASAGYYPIYNFVVATTSATKSMTVTWTGQSNVSAAVNPLYLQVYNFNASVHDWITLAATTTASPDVNFAMSAYVNTTLDDYYDNSFRTYYRVYQQSGTEILLSDNFNVNYTSPTSVLIQKHFRWRENNDTEVTAAWREAEDVGSPTASSTAVQGEVLRLRMSVANLGAGATSTKYRIEYASTTNGCAVDPGNWQAVTTDSSKSFRMSTTSVVVNNTATLKRLTDSEGYLFTTGRIVASSTNMSTSTSLSELGYTEHEYAFVANGSVANGSTFCFRMTASGTPLSSYDRYAEITIGSSSNTAPFFVNDPSDGGSSEISPTNNGDIVTFSATASDTPDELYYLAVCKTNSVLAGNNAAPTCGGGTWCVSAAASSTGQIDDQASCDYTAATTSETLNWYAFVCDKQSGSGVAKCSAASQGSGGVDPNSDSPFVINHAPNFTMLYTASTTQNPGSTFYIKSTSSDPDVSGGADTFNMFVCLTNAATKDGCVNGANDTVCSAMGTTTNAGCAFTDVAPTPYGTVTYYGFIFDEHDFAATANSRSSSYTIDAVVPIVSTPVLNGGQPIFLNPRGAADTMVIATASVSSTNGCQTGIQASVASIFMSKFDYNCAQSSSTCYQLGTSKCLKSGCVDANDQTAVFTCSVPMSYFTTPTDDSAGNINEPYVWHTRLYVSTPEFKYGAATSTGVELMSTVVINVTSALYVNEPIIDFGGNLNPGNNTGTVNQPTTIINAGNSPLDTNVAGEDMLAVDDTIVASNMRYSLTSGFNWLVGTSLSNSDAKVEVDILKATTTAGTSRTIYWGIGIPGGKKARIYNGQNTFTALLDPTLWQ